MTAFQNQLLRALEPKSLAALRPHLRKVRFQAGSTLCEPGDSVEAVYFPESGLFSAVTPLASGQSIDVTSRGRDGAIGYVEAVGGGVMSCRIVVQIAGEAHCAPASAYARLYAESEHLRILTFRRVEMLLQECRQSVACQAFHSTSQRFAKLLLECSDHTGMSRFALTQDFVASMVGAGRPRINQVARDLQAKQIIRYTRGDVQILDPPGLARNACECYPLLRGAWRNLMANERKGNALSPAPA